MLEYNFKSSWKFWEMELSLMENKVALALALQLAKLLEEMEENFKIGAASNMKSQNLSVLKIFSKFIKP